MTCVLDIMNADCCLFCVYSGKIKNNEKHVKCCLHEVEVAIFKYCTDYK